MTAGVAFVLLTGTAIAQSPPPPASPDHSEGSDVRTPPSPGDHGAWGDMRDEDRPSLYGEGHHFHHPPPPHSKAARFHIEMGDTNLGIKCADDAPMKECADFTLQLIDKLQSLSKH
jgi:hypothetical protein